MSRVILYSRPGCHLCDDARVVVERVCAELGETFEEVDITGSDDLLRQFQVEIPVTFVDGRKHEVYWVSEAGLRDALTA